MNSPNVFKSVLIFLSVSLLTCILACSESVDEASCPDSFPNDGEIEIRIRNISAYDFDDIFVDTNDGKHNYCSLASGETSFYRRFKSAYRYAFVELEIDDAVFTIQPIDFVGETLLDSGKYTYVLDASDSGERYGRLSIELEED